jgi:pimeloyl-ACP methyl ester carboxylesterase
VVETSWLGARLPGVAGSVASFLQRELHGRDPRPENVLTGTELAGIRQPALFIWGEDDNHFCPLPQARTAIARIPRAHLEVVPGGHHPRLGDPLRRAALITSFVSANPADTGKTATVGANCPRPMADEGWLHAPQVLATQPRLVTS